jgi:PAS domain S-box-containing protein
MAQAPAHRPPPLAGDRFRRLVESAPDVIFTLSPDGVITSLNPAFQRIMGWPAEEWVGRTFEELLHPDDRRRAREGVRRVLAGDPAPQTEFRVRARDGAYVVVEVTTVPDYVEGVIAGVLGIARDTTLRRRSEERLRLAAAVTNDAIYDWDLVTDRTWWSDAVTRLFGYTPDPEGGGGSWFNAALEPAELDRVMGEIHSAIAAGRDEWSGEYRVRRADGTVADVFDRGHIVYSDSGTPLRMIGAITDMSAAKESERQHGRLRDALMASTVDWTLTFDAIGSPILILGADGRIKRLNRDARVLAGRSAYADLLGLTPAEVGPDEPWATMDRVAITVRDRGTAAAAAVTAAAAGERSWYVAANPVDVPGEEARVIVIGRDVTDLVELQRSLRHTETMSALGSLIAGVAHEVRNPLFAVSATVDAFEARFGVQEQYARYTETLRREVRRLGELMRELLEYGKPPQLGLVDVAVDGIVREALDHSAAPAEAAGVTVRADVPPGIPPVRVDPGRIVQVLVNLLENAVQHTPRGGAVVVRAAVERDARGEWVALRVADAGPGFRPADLPHIFEPFFTRRRGGTGLGLSIVERIVDQHGGSIAARNRPEGGAEVTVRLRPAVRAG